MALENLEAEKARLLSRLRLLENGVRQSFLRDSELRKLRFRLEKTMEKMKPKRLKIQKERKQAEPQGDAAAAEDKPGLYNLGEPEFDLERLVAEYRKGRKTQ